MLKVAKFGGSSLSDGNHFAKVKSIVESDSSRRVVVVSAPGKRSCDDNKVTDLLYLCCAHIKYDVSYDTIFEMIEDRFNEIKRDCGLSIDLDAEFQTIRDELENGAPTDYIVSRGEYLSARLMAEYLSYTFVDSSKWVSFKYDGKVNYEETENKLRGYYEAYDRIVLPGFYGALPNGKVRTFTRGGSDVTGAIAAASLDADVYENWTDVTGIKMVDPRIVDNPKTIKYVTYAELRELSYMGASVLHEDTVSPVRRKDIPLNIKNTDEPQADGTVIRAEFPEEDEDSTRFITGITGKKGYSIINIYTGNMGDNMRVLRKVIEICEHFDVGIAQIPSGVDSFSLVVPTKELEPRRYDLIADIKRECEEVDEVKVTDGISIIAIVGRMMAYKTGVSGRLFSALGDNRINIRTIEQSADEINITVGVFTEDFERAIRVLYESFAV